MWYGVCLGNLLSRERRSGGSEKGVSGGEPLGGLGSHSGPLCIIEKAEKRKVVVTETTASKLCNRKQDNGR